MLLDTRNKSTTTQPGFNPTVQNDIIPATKTTGGLAGFIILSILTLSIFFFVIYVGKGNWFKRMQIKANTASSTIDVQLKQRRDTLIKLVDACKSSIKFENETLTQITSLRKVNSFVNNKDSSSNIKALDNMSSKILATVENYPNLQSVAVIRDLMSSADYLEREIAASRRVYNAVVNEFNEKLYVWPTNIIAASNKLVNLPLFQATVEDSQDVKLNI